jgi:pilus assembly protein CpaE
MMPEVTLCADTVSLQHPECIGLDNERIEAQPWLKPFSNADEARAHVRSQRAWQEVWVAGSDQVDAINLAAALKRDAPDGKVCLLAFEGTGSLYSRARAAGIDEVLDRAAFVGRYGQRKRGIAARPSEARKAVQAETQVLPPVERHRQPASVPCDSEVGLQPQVVAASSVPVAQQAAKGYMLTIVGAGGGVGKSTIAALCACLAQGMGFNTVLVDADLQFGDVHYLTGCDGALRCEDLLAAPSRIEALVPQGRLPAILACPRHLEQSEAVLQQLPRIIDDVRSRFDVVVVNTGANWGDSHMQLLEAGSNSLFVLDQRPSSIRSCQHALELCARCGVAAQPFLFAINRCSRSSLFSSIDVSCALQGAHVVELQEGGRDVEELLGSGQPLELIDSNNALCVSIRRFLDEMLPRTARSGQPDVPERAVKRRLLHRSRRKKAACL